LWTGPLRARRLHARLGSRLIGPPPEPAWRKRANRLNSVRYLLQVLTTTLQWPVLVWFWQCSMASCLAASSVSRSAPPQALSLSLLASAPPPFGSMAWTRHSAEAQLLSAISLARAVVGSFWLAPKLPLIWS